MRQEIRIISSLYDAPLDVAAIITRSEEETTIKWLEKDVSEGTTSTFLLTISRRGGEASLIRTGEIKMELAFKEGITTEGKLYTPYGIIESTIKTNKLVFDNGLLLEYEMLINGGESINNLFKIEYK